MKKTNQVSGIIEVHNLIYRVFLYEQLAIRSFQIEYTIGKKMSPQDDSNTTSLED